MPEKLLRQYISLFERYPLHSVAGFICLIPIIIILFKKQRDIVINIIFIQLLFNLLSNLLSFHLASNKVNNLLIANFSILINYLFVSVQFYCSYDSRLFKDILLKCSGIFVWIFIFDLVYSNPFLSDLSNHKSVHFSGTIQSALIILWCLFYFLETMQSLSVEDITRHYFFWVVSAYLIYHSVNVFVAPIAYYYDNFNSDKVLYIIDLMPYIFEYIMIGMISIGLIRNKDIG